PEKALNFAIQIQADKVGTIPDAAFEKAYQEVQKEVKTEVPIQSQSNTIKNEKINREGDTISQSKENADATANGKEGVSNDTKVQQKEVLKKEGVDTKAAPLTTPQPEKKNMISRKGLKAD